MVEKYNIRHFINFNIYILASKYSNIEPLSEQPEDFSSSYWVGRPLVPKVS